MPRVMGSVGLCVTWKERIFRYLVLSLSWPQSVGSGDHSGIMFGIAQKRHVARSQQGAFLWSDSGWDPGYPDTKYVHQCLAPQTQVFTARKKYVSLTCTCSTLKPLRHCGLQAYNLCYSTLVAGEDKDKLSPDQYLTSPTGDVFVKSEVGVYSIRHAGVAVLPRMKLTSFTRPQKLAKRVRLCQTELDLFEFNTKL